MQRRVGIYLRVSTQGQSTDLQRKEIEAFLESRGWGNGEIFEDKLTGTTAARPELRRLLNKVRERKLDIVICWKMDRLFRSLKDLVSTLQDFNDLGVSFISLKDHIDLTTASGRLLTHLLGAFAEFEASLIRERVVAGLNEAKRKGIRLGRPPRINEAQVIALRSSGLSLTQIGRNVGATKSAVHKTLRRAGLQGTGITEPKTRNSTVEDSLVLETPPTWESASTQSDKAVVSSDDPVLLQTFRTRDQE